MNSSKHMPVPSEADCGDYRSDLDAEYAHRPFAGKTNEEVIPLFEENVLERCFDIGGMPDLPFRYYVTALRDFVPSLEADLSDASHFSHASAASRCFLRIVEEQLKRNPSDILPILSDLMPAVERIAVNEARFDAKVSIYGSFRERLERIQQLARDNQVGGK
jgi:hypothetical protein